MSDEHIEIAWPIYQRLLFMIKSEILWTWPISSAKMPGHGGKHQMAQFSYSLFAEFGNCCALRHHTFLLYLLTIFFKLSSYFMSLSFEECWFKSFSQIAHLFLITQHRLLITFIFSTHQLLILWSLISSSNLQCNWLLSTNLIDFKFSKFIKRAEDTHSSRSCAKQNVYVTGSKWHLL